MIFDFFVYWAFSVTLLVLLSAIDLHYCSVQVDSYLPKTCKTLHWYLVLLLIPVLNNIMALLLVSVWFWNLYTYLFKD